MIDDQWWIVHVEGPDDVHTLPTEQEARDLADDLNGWFGDDFNEAPHVPRVFARVYSPDEWAARR